jgi:hypothetical protein
MDSGGAGNGCFLRQRRSGRDGQQATNSKKGAFHKVPRFAVHRAACGIMGSINGQSLKGIEHGTRSVMGEPGF